MGVVPALGMGRHGGTQDRAMAVQGMKCLQRDATPRGTLQGYLCHQGTSSLLHGVMPMTTGPCVST